MASNVDDGTDDVQKIHKNNRSSVGRRITVKCADAILDWFVFPLLLFIQFGTTMSCQQQQGRLTVQWTLAMGVVSIFCLAAVGYRKVFRVHPAQSMTLLLLPEIFTNIVLATVMFADDLLNALYILIALTAVVFVAAAIGHVQIARYNRSIAVAVPKASDYRRLHQEEHDDSDDEWAC